MIFLVKYSISSNMFWGNCAIINSSLQTRSQYHRCLKTVLCWKVLLCQNELAPGTPASARVSVNHRGLERCVRVGLHELQPLLFCFPAFQHLFYLFNFWTRRTNLCILFFKDLCQHWPRLFDLGRILSFTCLRLSIHLLESNWQPTSFRLLSPNLYTHYLPALHREDYFQVPKRERFKHTSLICS